MSGITIANDAVVGTAAVVNVLSNADLNVTNLSLGTQGGSATLNINGSGSAVTQSGASNLTLGHATTGAAAINIGTTATGGTLTTGTGLFTINKTGTVNVGSGANTGSLIAGGDITIDGGLLQFNNNGNLFLFTNHTMNIQNGGRLASTGFINLGNTSTYNVTGAGSELSVSLAELRINNGNEVNVNAGAEVSTTSLFNIATGGGDGTLNVAGSGSAATSGLGGGTMLWGASGDTATVTFSENATGTFSNVSLANGATINDTDSAALVTVESGADVSFKDITMASAELSPTSATLTVTGAGSSVTLAVGDVLTLGHSSVGSATVNVLDGGALTVGAGGSTVLNATGTINIDGGTADLKLLFNNGGTINFTSGSLSLAGGLIVGSGGIFDTDLTLGSNQQLTVSGTTTVDSGHTLALNGGTFSTSDLAVNGTLAFNSGTLAITGAGGLTIGGGGPLGATFTLGAGRTLNVINTTTVNGGSLLVVENAGNLSSGTVNNSGDIALDGPSALIQANVVNNTGLLRGTGRIDALLSNQTAGEVRADTGEQIQFLDPGSSLNNGRINLLGGTVEFTQSALTNAAAGQIVGQGSLIAEITLNSGTIAFSGQANVLGDFTNFATGLVISSGGGPTTFFDDVVNDGEIRTSPDSYTVFFGSLGGSGTFTSTGTVNIEGDLAPGSSPAAVQFAGDVVFGADATLKIELGGITPGLSHDQVVVAGNLALDGTLDVSILPDFTPTAGQSFDILDWGSIGGAFSSLALPSLAGLTWDTSQLYTSGVLSLVTAGVPGDYNQNGTVDAADYTTWRDNLGSTTALPNDDTPGVGNDDYIRWKTNFGNTAGVGSSAPGSAGGNVASVPEPSAHFLLLILSLAAIHVRRHREPI